MRKRVELWMWAEACEFVRRAERLQQRFFEPAAPSRQAPCWEPPVDLFETEGAVYAVVALPGVDPDGVEVTVEDAALLIRGERALDAPDERSILHRLEIPNGCFERRVPLPDYRYRVREQRLSDGCLTLVLEKA